MKPSKGFQYSVSYWASAQGLVHCCYGRCFTQRELRAALVSASGGYLTSFLETALGFYLEDLIEYLEICHEIHKDPKAEGTELWATLAGSDRP